MQIRLKSIREENSVTLEKLAKSIGVGRAFLCRVEKGTKNLPLPLAVEIADYFNCTLDDLVGRKIKKED